MTEQRKHSRHACTPLVVLIGTLAVSTAWLLTPRYGPWACHAALSPICLAAAYYFGSIDYRSGWTARAGISSVVVGLFLAILSWVGAPTVERLMPCLATELRQLYGTLNHAPGPLKALPILVLTVVAEELVWRGELVAWLQKRTSSIPTIALATLSYALPVATSRSALLICVAFCLGALLTVQRIVLRTWLGPLVTHLVWALLVFVAKPLG